jgi:hypothetical protein
MGISRVRRSDFSTTHQQAHTQAPGGPIATVWKVAAAVGTLIDGRGLTVVKDSLRECLAFLTGYSPSDALLTRKLS